jgi:pyruvate formate lyase activating enzyme
MIAPYLDAANVDLKAFKEDYYKTYCGARLEPVLDTLRHMKALGVWVEVTTLVVPGLNDDPDELQELAGFIAEQLGPETPWHISRFHPTYRMTDRPPTPLGTLLSACEIGTRAGLHYVYLGNVPGSEGANTHCHQCGQLLIERTGFAIGRNRIVDDRCPDCHAQVHGVGMGGGTGGR